MSENYFIYGLFYSYPENLTSSDFLSLMITMKIITVYYILHIPHKFLLVEVKNHKLFYDNTSRNTRVCPRNQVKVYIYISSHLINNHTNSLFHLYKQYSLGICVWVGMCI